MVANVSLPEFKEDDFIISDFRFNDGQSLPQLKLHYRTIGSLKRDSNGKADNAILLLHSTTASGDQWLTNTVAGNLFQNGQAISASEHFIIIPDSIGHGQSSKPSDTLQSNYPKYVFADMVRAQYQLVTEHLQIDHLKLILGTSMGGMHTWVWATTFPDFMDSCCPIACLPCEVSGRNRGWRKAAMDSITRDETYMGGHYKVQPRGFATGLQIVWLVISSPVQWQVAGPDCASSDAVMDKYVKDEMQRQDANDFVYAFAASADYDPRPLLDKIKVPITAINFADDQINPAQLGILEAEMKKVEKGKVVVVPASEHTHGHSNQGHAELWEMYVAELLQRV